MKPTYSRRLEFRISIWFNDDQTTGSFHSCEWEAIQNKGPQNWLDNTVKAFVAAEAFNQFGKKFDTKNISISHDEDEDFYTFEVIG